MKFQSELADREGEQSLDGSPAPPGWPPALPLHGPSSVPNYLRHLPFQVPNAIIGESGCAFEKERMVMMICKYETAQNCWWRQMLCAAARQPWCSQQTLLNRVTGLLTMQWLWWDILTTGELSLKWKSAMELKNNCRWNGNQHGP